jgi:WD40 repeat protein
MQYHENISNIAVDSVFVLQGHSEAIVGLAWHPDKRTLASSSMDKTIRVWDTDTGGFNLLSACITSYGTDF